MPTSSELNLSLATTSRLPQINVLEQTKYLERFKNIRYLLDAFGIVIVLNQYLQVVYCNEAFLNFTNKTGTGLDKIIGNRTGEVLNCIHSNSKFGCGTSEHCTACGALQAILASRNGTKTSKECRITVNKEKEDFSLDLMVTTAPFSLELQDYIIVLIKDISDEKRRKALERIFFHDVINTAGGLHGLIQLLDASSTESPYTIDITQDLLQISANLLEEIKCQRDLVSAENNELVINTEKIESLAILKTTVKQFANHQLTGEKSIEIDNNSADIEFNTDPVLLKRILGNLLKNALEASGKGDIITTGVKICDSRIKFWVNNPAFMPRNVSLQIFQRSFSTKGNGRGLGTYSVKLLTERYLKGSVWFQSSEAEGTTFTVSIPLPADLTKPRQNSPTSKVVR
ncbi:histidine kinase [Desulfofarcimen acetoxidans DSM 771]|uniref:histidine kinase n=1 Tax=Desulfofarcimen acetoxidans (strain ATCC 49208 / DSM 771 / KCTC 5769 / VKM B-1644 / 5575) TaxID=485916 RepID=C8W329_DESAS|nr:HAMP domain-containing sensor histidine kinase [Desulfofarcimen acetoxidans]ACV61796.1 histidine kinase [Desulfofarcimen acetoxidans DSM 771]